MVLPHMTTTCPRSAANGKFRGLSLLLLLALLTINGCARQVTPGKMLETTAYCGCSLCCDWERGSYYFLKLDFWNRYVSRGPRAGQAYSGHTAAGTLPNEPEPGLFSMDTVRRPWMIAPRTLLFPWYLLPEDGTIAADTRYYPFGTRMYVPGWGWGRVEDRGGAIKGADRIDLFFDSHDDAIAWGRRKLRVIIERP